MTYIEWIEISNFKGLERGIRIQLGNPAVLIGPNNAGKTTVLQALSLWNRAVKAWIAKKGSGHQKAKRDAVGINRLLIMDIPVRETRYFWSRTRINSNRQNIPFTITVGVRMTEGLVRPLGMVFTYRDPETLYSKPADECMGDTQLLEKAAGVDFNLLYPMSGLVGGGDGHVEETLLSDGGINVLLGQGQTAQVLRNICYKVLTTSPDDWKKITEIMNRMFGFNLRDPKFEAARGAITLDYTQTGMDAPLEISLSGRGVQQMLLILAYLFSHKNGILLIDEPDAHLEILRQKQVFVVLKDVAEMTGSQVVIATHSEVILDEAIETNLSCIVNGVVTDLAKKNDVKVLLRSLGVQYYYKALVAKRLLITEGSTDVAMLRAFAIRLDHPVAYLLEDPFTFYMQDENLPDPSLVEQIEQKSRTGIDYRQFYYALKRIVPDLRAMAFRDGDGKSRADETSDLDFKTVFWKRYELENYFITPDRLKTFVTREIGERQGELFAVSGQCQQDIAAALHETLKKVVFDDKDDLVDEFMRQSAGMQALQLQHVKMSAFAEVFFEYFAALRKSSVLVNKGEYYRMISDMDAQDVPEEIKVRLDELYAILNRTEEKETRS